MELRREYAEEQKYPMQVKSLEGGLVNGYRSLNVLGLGEKEKQGLLCHWLFSSQAPGFLSEKDETGKVIDKVCKSINR